MRTNALLKQVNELYKQKAEEKNEFMKLNTRS